MASIDEQLKRIVAKRVKLSNGKTIEQTLMEAVDYLYICIQSEIDAMYDAYTPSYYNRRPFGENLRSALYVEDFLDARIKGNRIELSLKFSSNVWAWNFDHSHKSNVAVLMNEGWGDKSMESPDHPRGIYYFEGWDFIGKGIKKFNESNRWGVTVSWEIDSSNWY